MKIALKIESINSFTYRVYKYYYICKLILYFRKILSLCIRKTVFCQYKCSRLLLLNNNEMYASWICPVLKTITWTIT